MIVLAPLVLSTSLLALVPSAPAAEAATPHADVDTSFDTSFFEAFDDRASLRPLPEPPELSKKQQWLVEKSRRLDVRITDQKFKKDPRSRRCIRRPSVAVRGAGAGAEIPSPETATGTRIEPLTTLFNLRTKEALPLLPGYAVSDRFHHFLRDYTTNQATRMDTRLIGVLERVALKFSPERIEVVSGYRSPKYNLSLRKKGRQVAKSSQHSEGHAVDFRIRGVPTRRLLNFVKSLQVGGVGYYPHSQFVHSDTGRIRFWRGT
jgi:hypothetical protein